MKQETTEPDAVVWQEEDGMWLGYLREHPDFWTQGEDLDDLREHLSDLYLDITSGSVPGVGGPEDG